MSEANNYYLEWMKINNKNRSSSQLLDKVSKTFTESYENFLNPIEYVNNEEIEKMREQTKIIRQSLKQEKDSISDFSKTIYKKAISRDHNEYKFGNFDGGTDKHLFEFENQQKPSEIVDMNKIKLEKKGKMLARTFNHNFYEKGKGENNVIQPLTLEIIKEIDSKDFAEKYKNVEFGEFLIKKKENEKYDNPYEDISENLELDNMFDKFKFSLVEKQAYFGPKSSKFLFKIDDEIDFWRKNPDVNEAHVELNNLDILKKLQNFNPDNPSAIDLMEFASGKINQQILARYFQIKKKHQAEIKSTENHENLEESYRKMKEEYENIKQRQKKNKANKVELKLLEKRIQTLDELKENSFDSYFEEGVKDLLLKLENLNNLRDKLFENEKLHLKNMVINICYEIKNILFQLLALILKNEGFPEYEDLMTIDDSGAAEKKMLQLIYHHFHNIKNPMVDGIEKVHILNVYLEEREKNDKVFEFMTVMVPTSQK